MFTKDEAQKLGQKVLGYSTFPECQVTVTSVEEAYTRFANNGITTASLSMRRNVSVSVTRDGRSGQYAVDDIDDASLKNAVQKAEELAAIAPPNPERMPAVGAQKYPSVNDFDEATANARAPQMIPHVKTIIDEALKRKLVAAGLIERSHRVTGIANKNGLFGFMKRRIRN
jgi:predicted Zn-dependent protease